MSNKEQVCRDASEADSVGMPVWGGGLEAKACMKKLLPLEIYSMPGIFLN